MDIGSNLANLLVAAGLSGLISFEREFNQRDASLRTHIKTRMAARVVSGIGFIGAGTIFRAGESSKGLTTAAGLWTVAEIGSPRDWE